jgi:dsDNA-specific endonuclease/ATPase MutS2
MHDSVKKYLTDSREDFSSELNPIMDESPRNMKQVGKSMFIINNNEQRNEQHLGSSSAFTTSLKDRIQQCVEYAEKKPAMRKKLVESMLDLENQLNEIRAEEGFLAQMKA